MTSSILLGLEIIVDDLDRAVSLFVDLLGFEVHQRGPAERVAGNAAVVTDGRIAVTLLHPDTSGGNPILPDRSPRLSQVILGTESGSIDELTEAVVEAGLAVTPVAGGFYLTPESVSGALGIETAIVMTSDG